MKNGSLKLTSCPTEQAPSAVQLRFVICQHVPLVSGIRIGDGVVTLMLQEDAQNPGNSL